ncbi:unnamed protein product [Pieris macdunnoughi]|uniref:Uncharacterized protein n=1 Tax=Pieris macdunnoughi TaxID=345717 RepID=A0A821SK95_9NEOP|nr:unnamed protein product [Pieris macdunnoughi]
MPIVPMATSARALLAISALLAVLFQESLQNVMPNQTGIWSCRYLQNYEPEPLLVHGNDEAINNNFFHKLKKVIKKSKQGIKELLRKREEKKILKKQRLDEMSRINSLKYEQIMQQWQMKLNVLPRKKRSANELQNFFNRIKNIIPGYLRGKVKPVVDKKKGNVSKSTKRHHGRRTRKPHQKQRHTTLKTTTVLQK